MLKNIVASLSFLLLLSNFVSAQRNLRDIPDPDPKIELDSFIVPDYLEVNLFAADPKMAKPIHMNFDAQGRLWIASSETYPHIKPGAKANDKIIVLEDTDHDGKSDKSTVFADGLLIPTGVLPGDGGCYAVNSTELLYFSDTDGDGKADYKRTVLSGFGTEDTHHLLHSLRWGHDGMMYMNQSIYIHSHVETPHGVRRLNGGGIWQFRPETMHLDVFCRGFVNPWGHHFDRWGQSFATDGAYGEGINYVFPGSVFVTAVGAKRTLRGLNPGSPKHCGLEVVSGRHFPEEFQGNMITNDFRANRVCRFVVTEDGSGYSSRQEVELIKTKHVAFRPIDAKMGPDGAIYIADWYNPIIQHGEVDFRDPRRDHVHGRIWRITAKNRKTLKPEDLTKLSIKELLERLKAPEDWVRLHAKLQLKQRNPKFVLPMLARWIETLDPKDKDFRHHRLEALWLYQCLNETNPQLLVESLSSGDHRVRAAAVRVCSMMRKDYPQAEAAIKNAISDSHPRVRLEAIRALSKIQTPQAAQLALTALDKPMDRFLDFALWQCMRDLQSVWLPLVEKGELDFGGNIAHLSFALKAVDSPSIAAPLVRMIKSNKVPANRMESALRLLIGFGKATDLDLVFSKITTGDSISKTSRATLIAELSRAAATRGIKPTQNLEKIISLIDSTDLQTQIAAIEIAGTWKVENAREKLTQLCFSKAENIGSVKHNAIYAVGKLGGQKSLKTLSRIVEESPFDQKIAATNAMVQINLSKSAENATRLLKECPKEFDPANIVSNLLVQKNGQATLRKALSDAELPADVAKSTVRAVRSSPRPDQSLIEQLQKSGKLEAKAWKSSPELVARIVEKVAQQGDAKKGQLIYRRNELQCLNCHAIGGSGGNVGPDLLSVGASAPVDYLVESMIDPNAKVKENFHSKIIETVDGLQVSGIPIRRDKKSVVLRNEKGQEIEIQTEDIDSEGDGRSLMPDGSVDSLTENELVDLITFLSRLGKVGEFSVGNDRVARTWESLVWTKEGNRRLNRTSYDTAATNDAALTWKSEYSLISGDLPVKSFAPFTIHRGLDPTSFVRCKIIVTTGGKVGFNLPNVDGLSIWIDGKPTPIKKSMQVDWKSGTHVLTFAINKKKRDTPIRLELIDVKGSGAKAQFFGGK